MIEHELPERRQREEIPRGVATQDGKLPAGDELGQVLDAAAGLTRYEAEGAFSLELVRQGQVSPETIWELKSQQLKKSGLVSLHRASESFAELGGLESLKDFCQRAMRRQGASHPLRRPRGVLLLGVPILYQYVDPLIKKHHVGFLGVHHTPKTNNRDTSDYGKHDYQYLPAGDARVANWPRSMVMIEEVRFPVYRFRIAKRGHRAGWTWEGKPVVERFFRHHNLDVRWCDALPEDITEARRTENYQIITSIIPAA